MKAVVWHGAGDIRLDNVRDPKIEEQTDAVVRLTVSAICGTDPHMVRGSLAPMVPGTILGHEGVGVIEAVGRDARNFKPGDRVVIASTVSVRLLRLLPCRLQQPVRHGQPQRPRSGDGLLRRTEGNRTIPGLAGRVRAYPVCRLDAGETVRRGDGRPGDPLLRHLHHRLLRRRLRRYRAGSYGGDLRLRPGRTIHDRPMQRST